MQKPTMGKWQLLFLSLVFCISKAVLQKSRWEPNPLPCSNGIDPVPPSTPQQHKRGDRSRGVRMTSVLTQKGVYEQKCHGEPEP